MLPLCSSYAPHVLLPTSRPSLFASLHTSTVRLYAADPQPPFTTTNGHRHRLVSHTLGPILLVPHSWSHTFGPTLLAPKSTQAALLTAIGAADGFLLSPASGRALLAAMAATGRLVRVTHPASPDEAAANAWHAVAHSASSADEAAAFVRTVAAASDAERGSDTGAAAASAAAAGAAASAAVAAPSAPGPAGRATAGTAALFQLPSASARPSLLRRGTHTSVHTSIHTGGTLHGLLAPSSDSGGFGAGHGLGGTCEAVWRRGPAAAGICPGTGSPQHPDQGNFPGTPRHHYFPVGGPSIAGHAVVLRPRAAA
eukprot:366308-Chlamydomonas_euryale.AAC.2